MPKRSHQIAAKQAELRAKKRRAPKRAMELQAQLAPVQGPPSVVGPDGEAPQTALQTSAIARVMAGQPSFVKAPTPTPRANNPYIWPEMKRIGILAGLTLSILAVLTFVLR